MANYRGARARLERRYRRDLGLFSGVTPRESKCRVGTPPGQHGARGGKLSQYGRQFSEKQALRCLYGVLERQFRNSFIKAKSMSGPTGENLIRLLEQRLDNVVFLAGLARTRREARQLVAHRAISVQRGDLEHTVDRPSFSVKPGDEIAVREKAKKQGRIQEALELAKQRKVSEWLAVDSSRLVTKVVRLPERDEGPRDIDELLVVELYSK